MNLLNFLRFSCSAALQSYGRHPLFTIGIDARCHATAAKRWAGFYSSHCSRLCFPSAQTAAAKTTGLVKMKWKILALLAHLIHAECCLKASAVFFCFVFYWMHLCMKRFCGLEKDLLLIFWLSSGVKFNSCDALGHVPAVLMIPHKISKWQHADINILAQHLVRLNKLENLGYNGNYLGFKILKYLFKQIFYHSLWTTK